MEIFSMAKRIKSKHKFGKMEVCKVDEVREYFLNPEIENEALGQCTNSVWISEKFLVSLVKVYYQK